MVIKQSKHLKTNIAVIEDDVEMRSVMFDFLESHYRVHVFSNPREFLDNFAHSLNSLSVIISDLHMPEMNGFEFLDVLRESEYFPPVIVISANAPMAMELQLKQKGASAFLRKPFRLSNLLETVQGLSVPGLSAACLSGNLSSKRVL